MNNTRRNTNVQVCNLLTQKISKELQRKRTTCNQMKFEVSLEIDEINKQVKTILS